LFFLNRAKSQGRQNPEEPSCDDIDGKVVTHVLATHYPIVAFISSQARRSESMGGLSGGSENSLRGSSSAQRYLIKILDEIDESRAIQRRLEFGRKRWLLSWLPSEGGQWIARLSDSGPMATIESRGKTRVEAIDRAARLLNLARLLSEKRARSNDDPTLG
jgi:hypothetical protein